ncbi:putative MFS family arabinose efflux permease [Planifilum fimeticola]|uniref:Putative MFS family arabinose efflux permease n=1 Tax=Planifilum fimeticola TaxID=201975 RepID=A0A2T0L9V5_9BACL|nr:MFS transporter [Planifilum fimeticola]PRX38523.1 putative MFS family arabinose efflux permease [Planifilum fimeticola]
MPSLLLKRSFFPIWIGQAVAGTGGSFATFVQSWLMYELTGSKLAMGSLWLVFMLPGILVQLVSGPYLDRWEPKRVMIAVQWSRAAIFLLPFGMLTMDALEAWHLYLTTVVTGMTEHLFRPAGMAYVAGAFPAEKLARVNSILEGTMQLTLLTGPALAGWVLAESEGDSLPVLAALIAMMAGSGASLLLLPRTERGKNKKKETWLRQLAEGFRFFRLSPLFLWTGLLMTAVNFCAGAFLPMVLPFVTERLGGSSAEYGLYMAAYPLGFMLGTLYTGWAGEPSDRRRLMLGGLLVQGGFMVLIAWTRSFPVALMLETGIGVCAALFTVQNTTLYQRHVPAELRGRVFVLRMLIARIGFPLGALFAGGFAEWMGLPLLFTLLGGIVLAASASAWLSPVYRELNRVVLRDVAKDGSQVSRAN